MNKINSPKFEFLDGLRGLSALLVVFYHGQLFSGHSKEYLTSSLKPLTYLLSFGHYSVAVFIVLSGFCLSIPVAVSADKQLKGGFKRYISRRFTRIVPPYYATLILMLILIFAFPILQTPQNTAWDSKIPVTIASIITHILLIHNLSSEWIYNINGPMWSVATEFQIYFIFPILIFIWRKYNLIAAFIFAMVLGFIIPFKFHLLHPWYLGLFAMGMAASIICFSKEEQYVKIKNKINWSLASKLSIIGLLLIPILTYKRVDIKLLESYAGVLICIILINFTLIEMGAKKRPVMLKLFNTKFAIYLGVFSYSIYLIHSPLLGFFNLLILDYSLSINIRLLIMFAVFIPIALIISYLFHVLVERRFMPNHLKKEEKAIINAVENKIG